VETWLSVGSLDRCDEHRRDADWVAAQWRHPDARLVLVDGNGAVASDPARRALAPVAAQGVYDPGRHLLLGFARGRPWFTSEGQPVGPSATLRQLGAVLTGLELELVVGAVALLVWHRLEPHCSRCGSHTEVRAGGASRWCPNCGSSHFPRQDPAVIVAVIDADDRILLGRQASWDPGRMSVLAGFVEAGESLEQAVHREVLEESGVRLGEVRYHASQPWPFPRSLMLGFVAHAVDSHLRINHDEIETADWYSRDELGHALTAGQLTMPGRASIAHRLITAWQHRLL
jgi:NAD+ diphosphatase